MLLNLDSKISDLLAFRSDGKYEPKQPRQLQDSQQCINVGAGSSKGISCIGGQPAHNKEEVAVARGPFHPRIDHCWALLQP